MASSQHEGGKGRREESRGVEGKAEKRKGNKGGGERRRAKERGLKDVFLVICFLQISHLLELPELPKIALSAKKSSFQC